MAAPFILDNLGNFENNTIGYPSRLLYFNDIRDIPEDFGYVSGKSLEGLFIDRMEQNEEITAKFTNENRFQKVVTAALLRQVYEQIHSQGPA